ncbi:DUF1540 domain-containing protein [Acetivibrio straminisolvens]|jgi:hypothetical protein|uniref:DUF1540 domain-containing protein n=1 Tax=Acetivibrio straminisolvens TaxID=253314 RepID=UPI00223FD84C|nr:DUF1540 domain-containing protein [Acetivibrio straminisolvens]
MKVQKMNRPNEGVKCVVNTCHYYMSGDYCAAEKIEVQPRNAADSQETDCATFVPNVQG